MRKPQGFLIETPADGSRATEHDTVTCGHCEYISVVPPGMQPARQCRKCMRYLCRVCYGKISLGGPCVPMEKKLDLYEREPWRYVLR